MGDYRVRLGGIDFHAAYPGPAPLWHILQSISGWEEKAQDGTDTSQHWSGQGSTAGAAQT